MNTIVAATSMPRPDLATSLGSLGLSLGAGGVLAGGAVTGGAEAVCSAPSGATLNELRTTEANVLAASSTLLPRGGRQCADTGNRKQTTIVVKDGKIVSWVLS